MTDAPLLEIALSALRLGLCVVPPKEDGSKAPFTPWARYVLSENNPNPQPPSEAELTHWYTNGQAHSGIGLICGLVSGNLEMLEFEGRAVKDGLWDEFKAAAEAAGLLPLLSRIQRGYGERTPSGGIHLLFRVDGKVEGNQPLARRPSTDEELFERPQQRSQVLIETRGEGGYVVVAPSSGAVHETHGAWTILAGGFSSIEMISTEERAELLALARTFDRLPRPEAGGEGAAPPPGGGLGSRPGDDYNARARWPEILQPHGWASLFTTKEGNQHWRRPGKNIGTSATINQRGDGVLYVFSSSTPFDPERGYSKFSAYAVLEHAGDFAAAARELRRQGYGTPSHANGHAPDVAPGAPETAQEASEPCPRLPVLPEEFWASREVLSKIRTAAHARIVSADSVLVALLARLSAGVPHQLAIPAIVGTRAPLSLLASLTGPPGSGKSGAYGVARELLPLNPEVVKELPIGSGEGLIECLFEVREVEGENGKTVKRKVQTRYNAAIYVDEGELLTALGTRNGASLFPTLRQIWSGGILGQANSAADAWRVVPAGAHTYGLVVSFQPSLAGSLLSGAEAGTPQRILWASSIDPHIPDEPPEAPMEVFQARVEHLHRLFDYEDRPRDLRVAEAIWQEIRARQLASKRGELIIDPLRTHRDLLKLKVAAALAILERDLPTIDVEDWQLAEVLVGISDGILGHVQATVQEAEEKTERAAAARQARRHVEAVAADEGRKTVLVAERIRQLVASEPMAISSIRRLVTPARRDFLEDGLQYAITKGWVEERSEPGQGDSKRMIHPKRGGQ